MSYWNGWTLVNLSAIEADSLLSICNTEINTSKLLAHANQLKTNNPCLETNWHLGSDISIVCLYASLQANRDTDLKKFDVYSFGTDTCIPFDEDLPF